MKTSGSLFIFIVLLFQISTSAQPNVDTVFFDDFSSGNDSRWTKKEGGADWAVQNGEYHRGRGAHPATNFRFISYIDNPYLTDYTVESKVKVIEDSSGGWGVLCFRIQDSTTFYMLQFEPYKNQLALDIIKNGVPFKNLGIITLNTDLNVWYKLKVDVKGDSIIGYVDDEVKFAVKDTTFASGSAGLAAWHAHTHFDDFLITVPANRNNNYYALDENTIAYWDFNTSSSTIFDRSGNNLHGALFNTAHNDSSAKFSRTSSSYGRFPTIDPFLTAGTFTMQARVKIDHKPQLINTAAISTIFGYTQFNATSEWGYELRVETINNKCYLGMVVGEATKSGNKLLSSTPIDTNVWYDLAVQYDKTFLTIFVNGVINAQMPYSKNLFLRDSSFYVGRRKPGTPDFFLDGHIKEVVISNVPRLAYNNLVLVSDANTVGLWRFNSLTNNTAIDESANKNHGTITGNVVCTTSDARTYYKMRSNSANISINNITELKNAQYFKIEAVVKSSSFDYDISRPIFYLRDNIRFDSLNIALTMCQDRQRVFAFTTNGFLGVENILKTPIPIGLENNWFKICAEYENGIRRIYLNDSCVAQDSIKQISRFPQSYNSSIGNDNVNSLNWYFNSDIDELKISAVASNRSPIFTSTPDTIALENHLYSYPISVSDPDSDAVTISLTTKPLNMTLRNDTIFFTPTIDQVGNQDVIIQATDSKGGTSIQSYRIKILPRSGQITLSNITPDMDTVTISEGDSILFSLTATSRNPSAEITYQWYKNDPMVSSTTSYKIRTNYQSAGTCSVKVVAYDGVEFIEKKWIVVTQNKALKPIIICPIQNRSANGDSTFKWSCNDPDLNPATTRYEVQFMDNSPQNTPILTLYALQATELRLNSLIQRTDLPEGIVLAWKVRAYDADGDTVPYSDNAVFFYSGYGTAVEKATMVRNICMATPNPFNPHTTITIEDKQTFKEGIVMISDISGRIVNRFKISKTTPLITFMWNGKNMYNNICPTGQYICTISSNEYRKTLKLILSK